MSGLLPIDLRSDFQLEIPQPPNKGAHEFVDRWSPKASTLFTSKPSTNFRREHGLHKVKLGIASFRRPRGAQANEPDSAQHQLSPSQENRKFGQIASKSKKCKMLAAVVRTPLIATAGNILP